MKTAIKQSISRVLVVVFCTVAAGAQGDGDPIPIEHFARKPAMERARLSPSGNRLAFLANKKDNTYLVTYDIAKEKRYLLTSLDNIEKRFLWVRWANEDQLLISILHTDEFAGQKFHKTTLLISDRKGEDLALASKPKPPSEARPAVGKNRKRHYEERPARLDDVIAVLPDDKHILLSADYEKRGRPAIYKINLNTQERKKVVHSESGVGAWISDSRGEWLAGVGSNRDGVVTVYIRKLNDDRSKRALWEYDYTKEDGPSPIGFNNNPKRLIIRAPLDDRQAIFAVDFQSDELERELLASDDEYDISGRLIWSPKKGNYVGAYYEGAYGRYIYWDDHFEALQKGVDAALPGGINRILTFSEDENRYMVLHTKPDFPPVFLLGDRSRKTLDPFGQAFPELVEAELPQRKAVSLRARDDQELEGYLTLPGGEQENLPTVVLPHGGPSGRDVGSFDLWPAFLASRGYAVVQVNFRGSVGYGGRFSRAQMQNWGLGIQDDITDATRWMVRQGVADPERICIVGHSYGGYSALMGATTTPDLFQCAVSSAGVADLLGFVKERTSWGSDTGLNMQLGSWLFDRGRLKQTSPVYHVENVKIPIMLIHGDEDRVVSVDQSIEMAEELESEGKPVKLIVQEGGDHSYSHYSHHLEFLSELEDFLAEHLGT